MSWTDAKLKRALALHTTLWSPSAIARATGMTSGAVTRKFRVLRRADDPHMALADLGRMIARRMGVRPVTRADFVKLCEIEGVRAGLARALEKERESYET